LLIFIWLRTVVHTVWIASKRFSFSLRTTRSSSSLSESSSFSSAKRLCTTGLGAARGAESWERSSFSSSLEESSAAKKRLLLAGAAIL
jgi:hypothetical protein